MSTLAVFALGFMSGSVGYPDLEPDPQDPHVVGPPGSGSFLFLINVLSGLK
jgi:hypothetical protein